MSNPFKTKQFKQLFEEWNEKLEALGFKDVEDFSLPEAPLKKWTALDFSRKTQGKSAASRQLVLKYYLWAEQQLESFTFDSDIHKLIWKMHSEGKTIREISRHVNQEKFRKTAVFLLIRKIRKEMIWTQAHKLSEDIPN